MFKQNDGVKPWSEVPLSPVVSKLSLITNSGELVFIMDIWEIRDAEIPPSASDGAAQSSEAATASVCVASKIQ